MKKSILLPLLALAYLVLVIYYPSLNLKIDNPECGMLKVSSYTFGDLLSRAKSNGHIVAMSFSLCSGALFLITLLYSPRILVLKRVYRLIFLPITFYTIYSLVLFNHYISNIENKECFELNFIYPIFSVATTFFFLLGLFLIFAKTKK